MLPIRATSRRQRVGAAAITCLLLVFYLGRLDFFLPVARPVLETANNSTHQHPVSQLLDAAQRNFDKIQRKQSKSLRQAVDEYRRRYGISPPPHFDKWYEFATRKGLVLVDEFDNIQQSMVPFWGLAPGAIRKRAAEALRSGDNLMRVVVEGGKLAIVDGGPEWMQEAMRGMMQEFHGEIAFNTIDEPRVVVPHDDLERLLARALTENIPAAWSNRSPIDSFSRHTSKSKDGTKTNMDAVSFTQLRRRPSWSHLRLTCHPDTPARVLDDANMEDDVNSYGRSELGFIYNMSAMSDVCRSPSLRTSHGFFNRPDTHSISYDLLPIFSQSKTSVNGDILYPSPWYWVDMVRYDAASDVTWSEKQDRLYWRGSTTGGYATDGNWKRHHRQRFVDMMSGNGSALVLSGQDDGDEQGWEVKTVERGEYSQFVDVAFTNIVQCEEADCAAQRAHFDVQTRASQQDGWRSKIVLDMDGNAFSGRFYALLRSRSLTLKFAIFREWHDEWLRPWVHYVPLSLQGKEWLDLVRHFLDGKKQTGGEAEARGVAKRSSDWAERALRKEDMEAWFFRVLLEYGRVIDDQRAYIGFTVSGAGLRT